MTVAEPPRPQRGSTAAERGPDVSTAQQAVVDERSWARRAAAAANPKFLLSQAEGYPVGIKQFLQFCLILVYPAWLFVIVLFWPVRAMHKRNNPEEYAAFQAEPAARKAAGGQR